MAGRRRLSGAFLIDIDRIEPDPNQPRKRVDPEHLEELTRSVRRHGVLQPITVRFVAETERYRIVAGECRYAASKAAGLSEMPCWVKSPKEGEILIQQVIENWVRSDLSPFELADSLAILRDANGWTQKDISRETGKSKGEISKLLSILDLDPDVQAIARNDASGRVAKSHLYHLSRLPVEEQTVLIEHIHNLSTRDVERYVERYEARRRGDRRGQPVFRRSFRTSRAQVSFVFRSDSISDHDVLQALHEVKRQIAGQDE